MLQVVKTLGDSVVLLVQVADGTKTLAAIIQIARAGNNVGFAFESSYILNKGTGRVAPFKEQDDSFVFDMLVQQRKEPALRVFQGMSPWLDSIWFNP